MQTKEEIAGEFKKNTQLVVLCLLSYLWVLRGKLICCEVTGTLMSLIAGIEFFKDSEYSIGVIKKLKFLVMER